MSSNLGIPSECWLSPAAKVGGSPIEGLGLFAVREIPAGEPVMRLGGQVIDDTALASLTPPYSSLCVGDGEHVLIDPAHPVRYGNHSCDPNLWHEDATTVVARRAIGKGEELTIDYATHTISSLWSMHCQCGSSQCRGTVSGDDWKRSDLQARYGAHWTPPLYAAIAWRQQIGPGPLGFARAIWQEIQQRYEAGLLLDDLARYPVRLADVGLSDQGLRDDMREAQRRNSPLRRYFAALSRGWARPKRR